MGGFAGEAHIRALNSEPASVEKQTMDESASNQGDIRGKTCDVARSLGKVVKRRGKKTAVNRWCIDFGTKWPPRMLHSFNGQAFESKEMASAILAHVEGEVARGRSLAEVLDGYRAEPKAETSVDALLARWIEVFRKRSEQGSRQPRTLREYERWANADGGQYAYFSYWHGSSVYDIDRASVEEWSFWLSEKGLSAKTVRNVMAGLHSFLVWVANDVLTGFTPPQFPWPEVDEHRPTILSQDMQWKLLMVIPEAKAGIFYFLAQTAARPSEARVLRVKDWAGDEIEVSRAAKDRNTDGVIRGLKSRNTKTLPVHEWPLRDWLDQYVSKERQLSDPDGPLFVNPDGRGEGWWSETAMRRTWAAACAKVGVTGVSLYEGTKHSTATHLKALGADDRLLAQLMGHRDSRSVEKYAKLDSSAIRAGLDRLTRRGRGSE